jgi:hypothetical protein
MINILFQIIATICVVAAIFGIKMMDLTAHKLVRVIYAVLKRRTTERFCICTRKLP